MQQSYIRIARTPEVNKVLSYLQQKLSLLSESEIIKVALSEKYEQEQDAINEQKKLHQAYAHAMKEGKKIGNKLIREKGLDPKKVTEQQFYDLFLDDHQHQA